MKVIPVVDLMGGVVVRARMGERAAYRPIETPLAASPEPVAIVEGLLRLAPFSILYIADLDAIQRTGDNFAAVSRLRRAFPELRLWIDNGAADLGAVEATEKFGVPVIGSESQTDLTLVTRTASGVLSLDFRGDVFLGAGEIWTRPDVWPHDIIVMTLARVGAGAGPDIDRIRTVKATAGARRVYAAGGLRDARDLDTLEKVGAAGVLVASALHDGRLRPEDLASHAQ